MAMGADASVEDAKYLWRRIAGTGKSVLMKNEIIQLTRGKFKKTDDMETGLQTLEEMNYIKREYQRQDGPGRPKEIIQVNPCTENTVNTVKQ